LVKWNILGVDRSERPGAMMHSILFWQLRALGCNVSWQVVLRFRGLLSLVDVVCNAPDFEIQGSLVLNKYTKESVQEM
jgi:hypothetical protein